MARTFPSTLIYPFFLPGGLLFAAVLLLRHQPAWFATLLATQTFLFWLIVAAGLFLGWRFNRSRLFLPILCLILGERLLVPAPAGSAGELLRGLVGVLLPLNLALFAGLAERGLLTRHGLPRLLLLAAQGGGVFWLYRRHFAETLAVFQTDWLAWPPATLLPLSQAVQAVLLLVAGLLLGRFLRRPGVVAAGSFWAVLTLAAGLVAPAAHLHLYLAAAALILVVGILETFHFMAFRDELTGLPARRALNEALLKVGGRYTLAMVDIDFFKKFNDRHGHDVGDQVLRMVATRLAAVGGGGRAYRYGGEEFALLFPGRALAETLPVLEDLRQAVAAAEFALRGRFRPRKKPVNPRNKKAAAGKLRVTVSIGAAERGGVLKEAAQVMKAADQALYRAKKAGRNQVCS